MRPQGHNGHGVGADDDAAKADGHDTSGEDASGAAADIDEVASVKSEVGVCSTRVARFSFSLLCS